MEGIVQTLLAILIKMRLMHRYYCTCGYKTNDRTKMVSHINTHPAILSLDTETGKLM